MRASSRAIEMNREAPISYQAPHNPLREIFTPQIVARLCKIRNPHPLLLERLEILSASGPYPSDTGLASRLRLFRARKASWETYLSAAFLCGLFGGDSGSDLRGRLTDPNDRNFRSAMSECLACWFLVGVLKLPVKPKPTGNNESILELLVDLPDRDVRVEVKAPYPNDPRKSEWFDDPSPITRCLKKAQKQFQEGMRNVLFLVFFEDMRLYWPRDLMIRAFIGEERAAYNVDIRTYPPKVDAVIARFPTGQLLNPNYPKPPSHLRRRIPHFTRISAVVLVQERFCSKGFFPEISHNVWIIHNPHADASVSPELWARYPQMFIREDGAMIWTDGYESWSEMDQRWEGDR